MTEPYDPYAPRVINREKRQAKRTVEAMEDAAEFSGELAAAGLISAEAHAETVKITVAISEKFGDKPAIENTGAQQLRQYIEQIEFLQGEIDAINDDKSDKFGEAKASGFDTKAMKRIIRDRKKSRDERLEEEAIYQTYLTALGMD